MRDITIYCTVFRYKSISYVKENKDTQAQAALVYNLQQMTKK